jgi:uncharacterized phiE125 gp8 family phage protein
MLARLITAAREYVEQHTNRQTTVATWELTLDRWPSGHIIRLPRPPLASVTSLKYYDADNVQQTWSSSNYLVRTSHEPGQVHKYNTVTWPTVKDRPDAIAVRYVAGVAQASVSQRIKAAILLLVGHWFENREAVVIGTIATEIPVAVQSLLEQLRVGDEFVEYEECRDVSATW